MILKTVLRTKKRNNFLKTDQKVDHCEKKLKKKIIQLRKCYANTSTFSASYVFEWKKMISILGCLWENETFFSVPHSVYRSSLRSCFSFCIFGNSFSLFSGFLTPFLEVLFLVLSNCKDTCKIWEIFICCSSIVSGGYTGMRGDVPPFNISPKNIFLKL